VTASQVISEACCCSSSFRRLGVSLEAKPFPHFLHSPGRGHHVAAQVQLFVGPKDGLFDKVLVDLEVWRYESLCDGTMSNLSESEEMELGHLQFWYWEVV